MCIRDRVVIFDRSWYNSAGVERVMGFASEEEVQGFLRIAPLFEKLLVGKSNNIIPVSYTHLDVYKRQV